ncbi:DUF1214 domain-containing protein [Mongoliimonas terrestris]|uniref:DUF1214 domain-containing protein n=1 Tax=Mongoliimonas terrestris TaxID=1709001 RepID=UPI0009498B7B|nr:DUF1214 domain-containing protein [Mongoliimonas terrestris]
MFLVVRLLIIAVIGATAGLGSVWLALESGVFDTAPRIGPWRLQAGGGGPSANPYAVAENARAGRIGLGPAEGIAVVAATDSAGNPLEPICHYAVEGAIPAAELWTLSVTDEAGNLPRNPAGRTGFTSRDAIRTADGSLVVIVGRTARPGNFVPTGTLGSVVLTLRLYGSGLAARLPGPDRLPAIRRLECGGGRGR